MRSSRLVPVLAAAAALLALASASAIARPHGLPKKKLTSGPCRVHLEVPKAPIAAGEAVTIFGTLSCPADEAAAGRQVVLYQHAANHPGFALVSSATTEATGQPNTAAFSFAPPLFEANSVFFVTSEGAKSAHRTIRVAPVVSLSTPPTPPDGAQLFTGGGRVRRALNAVTFAGKVSPVAAGAVVALQRQNATANEEWHRIAPLGRVGKNGEYSITHTFAVPGDASIRVIVRPRDKLNVPAASTPVSYEISQAQNPNLTIESTADPLVWGNSVGIKGVIKGAADKTAVTLLAHSKGGQFAPVATGQTGPGGAYEFTQTPLQNTYYKVTDATTSSAVLFQGVKYALTVGPVPSSIAVTQAATFTGTVMPPLAGHVVYLERQGALGLGWRVIDVGTLTAPLHPGEPASFSIAHSFAGVGSARLRIKVPGDPANQGIASPAFELNVTPSPAQLLSGEAPGNTKLPSVGQL
jgi:hypothetical protein